MEDNAQASPARIWAGMLAVYLIWGSTYLAIRFAVETIPPFLMAGIRFILAGSILFLIRRGIGDPLPSGRENRSAIIIGLALLFAGNGSIVWAEQYISSGLAALLVGMTPLWIILMEMVMPFGRRPTLPMILAVVIGFLGLFILFWPELTAGNNQHSLVPYLVVVVGNICWAFGSLYSRSATLPKSPLMGTAVEMLAGGLALSVLAGISGEFSQIHWDTLSIKSVASLGYLFIFGSLVGFAAYTWLLRVAPISLVSTYAYVNPVVALILGVVLGKEALSGRTILAAAVILLAVIFTSINTKRSPGLRTSASKAG